MTTAPGTPEHGDEAMDYKEMNADALRDFATTDDLIEAVATLREERDALAARISRLVDAGDELAAELEQWSLTEQHDETDAAFESWREARDQPAATSLARRDALAKAEALDDFSKKLGGTDQELAEIEASRYRRKAEGGDA